MPRDSRSRSPVPRQRPRYASDDRRGSPERDVDRRRRYEDRGGDERAGDKRDVGNDRYRRRGYDAERENGYRRGPGGREREVSPERGSSYGRRRGPERDVRRGDDRDRRRDERDHEHDRRAGPSTARRSSRPSSRPRSRPPSRSRSRPRSKSPSSEKDKDKDKGKPNFNQSGLLAAATNTVRLADGTATVLKYNEPPEARKSPIGWRLYVFKGKDQTDLLHIQRQSCYLIGRDKGVVDIYVEHPSCSKQHAVIQHRQVQQKDEFGSSKTMIKPFIIDLESTNGTLVNGETIPTSRYYELQQGDVIKFGQSTREYVLLHDQP